MDRRTVLQGTLGGWVASSLMPFTRAAAQVASNASNTSSTSGASSASGATDAPSLKRLSDKIAVLSGLKDNVLALSTGEGLLLVDSGSAGYTDALLGELRQLARGERVRTLINTHWHPDQTGSNAALGKAGATIIAQHKSRDWMATPHYIPGEDRYQKALPPAAWPTQTFYSGGAMMAGGEHVEYGHLLAAHTEGDCYVYLRDSNVLAVGHAASPVRDPQLDWFAGGWLGGRLDALTRLYQLANEQTQVVPAYGPVVSRSALKDEHDVLQIIYTRMVDYLRKGYSAQDMLDAGVMKGLNRTWADPRQFVYDAFKGLWGYQDTLAPNIV